MSWWNFGSVRIAETRSLAKSLFPSVGAVCLLGCAADKPKSESPAVFAGEGGAKLIEAKPADSGNAIATNESSAPCVAASPIADQALIDDFEDADHRAFKVYEREGWWWAANDGSAEGRQSPGPGQVRPTRLTTPRGTAFGPSNFAMRLTAEGYSEWGAAWGTSLRWERDGLKCPYNSENFIGVRFWARGAGRIRINITIPGTVAQDQEMGRCKESCWDHYGRRIELSEDWQAYVVPWAHLQQGGWGQPVPFDAARILSVEFHAAPGENPVEFWVDDIEFIRTLEAAEPAEPTVTNVAG